MNHLTSVPGFFLNVVGSRVVGSQAEAGSPGTPFASSPGSDINRSLTISLCSGFFCGFETGLAICSLTGLRFTEFKAGLELGVLRLKVMPYPAHYGLCLNPEKG